MEARGAVRAADDRAGPSHTGWSSWRSDLVGAGQLQALSAGGQATLTAADHRSENSHRPALPEWSARYHLRTGPAMSDADGLARQHDRAVTGRAAPRRLEGPRPSRCCFSIKAPAVSAATSKTPRGKYTFSGTLNTKNGQLKVLIVGTQSL